MKIAERLQGLYTQNRFNENGKRVQKPSVHQKDVSSIAGAAKNTPDVKDISIKQILSGKEVNSLNALFGYEQNGKTEIYGANKMRNVHSGILLDVKG